jgi:thioredoxin-related protein
MKRFKYIVLMVCIISFSACSSDDDSTNDSTNESTNEEIISGENPCDTTLTVQFEEVF